MNTPWLKNVQKLSQVETIEYSDQGHNVILSFCDQFFSLQIELPVSNWFNRTVGRLETTDVRDDGNCKYRALDSKTRALTLAWPSTHSDRWMPLSSFKSSVS